MVPWAAPGPLPVVVEDGQWQDEARGRTLRWRAWRPRTAAPVPCVIHSHGLGGSSASGADWLAHWASWGIAALAVQHPGTDAGALASASPLALRHLLRTAVDAEQLAARRDDLLFALDRIGDSLAAGRVSGTERNDRTDHTDCPDCPGFADAADAFPAIGLSGHSFGAASVLRLIGERRGGDDRPADARIAAAILFSPSARGGSLPLTERFADVRLPCLHLTGSQDSGIGPGDIAAADRLLPFAHMPGPAQYLLVLDGATHPEFSGQTGEGAGTARPAHRVALKAVSAAFWRAQLAGDADAAAWLAQAPLPVGIAGHWQRK